MSTSTKLPSCAVYDACARRIKELTDKRDRNIDFLIEEGTKVRRFLIFGRLRTKAESRKASQPVIDFLNQRDEPTIARLTMVRNLARMATSLKEGSVDVSAEDFALIQDYWR